MIRPEIDKRAYRTVPRQFVSEITYEPSDKHELRCECGQCRRMWQMSERYEARP